MRSDQTPSRGRSDEDISRVRIALRRINLPALVYGVSLIMLGLLGTRMIAGGYYQPLGVGLVAAAVVGLMTARRVVRALNEAATLTHCFPTGRRPIGAGVLDDGTLVPDDHPQLASEAGQ